MKNKAFASLLSETYVNGRGELCTNMATSRSKVAKRKRTERERQRLQNELKHFQWILKRKGRTEALAQRLQALQAQIAGL